MGITESTKKAKLLDEAVHKLLHDDDAPKMFPAYSMDWGHGGPIVEQNRISLWAKPKTKSRWLASMDSKNTYIGTSPLQAAMICFVEESKRNNQTTN